MSARTGLGRGTLGSHKTGSLRRGHRYHIVAPVCYRTAEGQEWFDASTVNMNHTGLLMKTRHPSPPLETSLELRVGLTPGTGNGSVIACVGRVVWTGSLPTGEMLLAVTIDEYRFEKPQLVSPCCTSPSPSQGTTPPAEATRSVPPKRQES